MIFGMCLQRLNRGSFSGKAPDRVTCAPIEKPALWAVGFRLRHSAVSPSDEDFVAACLGDGASRPWAPPRPPSRARSIKFRDGRHYEYLFGRLVHKAPETLPEGAETRRIREGLWVVYRSEQGDYKSIWRHFTETFLGEAGMGYDLARIPIDLYEGGQIAEVWSPVDPAAPKDAARVVTCERTPGFTLAGFGNFSEPDHPEHACYPFDARSEVLRRFPDRPLVCACVHSLFGKPLRDFAGAVPDDYAPVPADMQTQFYRGGFWRVGRRLHFGGDGQDWPFDLSVETRLPLDGCRHPRPFIEVRFPARGGCTKICVPMREKGEERSEQIRHGQIRLVGLWEDPLRGRVVPDGIFAGFGAHPASLRPGETIVAFRTRMRNGCMFFSEPLFKGVEGGSGDVPEGLEELVLPGGPALRLFEEGLTWRSAGRSRGSAGCKKKA